MSLEGRLQLFYCVSETLREMGILRVGEVGHYKKKKLSWSVKV